MRRGWTGTDGVEGALQAVRRAAVEGAPAIATAALASIGGLLVLMLSPVPMVRGFGLLLVVGVALAFLCALTAGSAAMVLAGRGEGGVSPFWGDSRARAKESLLRARARVTLNRIHHHLRLRFDPAWQGAREILTDNAFTRLVSRLALDVSVRRPGRVLGIGLALAVLGWGLDTQTHVQTDISKLAPQNLSSLRNLSALERATGVGGEIDLMVSSSSLTKPSTIEWMSSYESAILKHFGYSASAGCGRARLCPAFSLPDLFQSEEGALRQAQPEAVSAVCSRRSRRTSPRTSSAPIDASPRSPSASV